MVYRYVTRIKGVTASRHDTVEEAEEYSKKLNSVIVDLYKEFEGYTREELCRYILEEREETSKYIDQCASLEEELESKVAKNIEQYDTIEELTCKVEAYEEYDDIYDILPSLNTEYKLMLFEEACKSI